MRATKSKSYYATLNETLKEPCEAAHYLSAAMESGEPKRFLKALRRVVKAYGVANVAYNAGLGRESLYKTLSPTGNPTLSTLRATLKAVGIRMSFEAIK